MISLILCALAAFVASTFGLNNMLAENEQWINYAIGMEAVRTSDGRIRRLACAASLGLVHADFVGECAIF